MKVVVQLSTGIAFDFNSIENMVRFEEGPMHFTYLGNRVNLNEGDYVIKEVDDKKQKYNISLEELEQIHYRLTQAKQLLYIQVLKYAVDNGPDELFNDHGHLIPEGFPTFASFANLVGYEGESNYVDSLDDPVYIGEMKEDLNIEHGEIVTEEEYWRRVHAGEYKLAGQLENETYEEYMKRNKR